jgi:xanthine/uracil/vitamin C permease (AzgA family)
MTSTPRRAMRSAFDIRLVITLLIGGYGVVITVLGLWFTTDEEIERSAGVNINLWAGIAMLVVAALFGLWALLRPLRVPEPDPAERPAEDPS